MAITTRRVAETIGWITVAKAHNVLCAQPALVGSFFHADQTSITASDAFIAPSSSVLQITAINAVDLSTCITLMSALVGTMSFHMKDGIASDVYGAGAHRISDLVNAALLPVQYVATGAAAADLAAVVSGANSLKSAINAHFVMVTPSAVHFTNDGTNTIATANATVLSDSILLLNAIKTAVNAHIQSGPTTPMIKIVNA